jgi:hypothetical protein
MVTTAADVVLHINATDFAALAETADGLRGEDLVLVRDAEQKPRLREALQEGDVVATEVRVWTDRPPRKKIREVVCVPEEGRLRTLETGSGYDAVFWSDSAVEKFLYPYYHAQRLWNADMEAVAAKFKRDMDAVAIAHLAPSNFVVGRMVYNRVTRARTLDWIPIAGYAR